MLKLIRFNLQKDELKQMKNLLQKEYDIVNLIVNQINKILLKCISNYHPGTFLYILFDIIINSDQIEDEKESLQML
jgi:hypothetical protein